MQPSVSNGLPILVLSFRSNLKRLIRSEKVYDITNLALSRFRISSRAKTGKLGAGALFKKLIIKNYLNKVDTKPQARNNFDVTSFQRKKILQNFIMGTDRRTIRQSEL
jgi:hypothetical protein